LRIHFVHVIVIFLDVPAQCRAYTDKFVFSPKKELWTLYYSVTIITKISALEQPCL